MADAELEAFVREWTRALLERDVAAAAALRSEDYRVTIDGAALDRAQELALLDSGQARFDRIDVEALTVERRGERATLAFDYRLEGVFEGQPLAGLFRTTLACGRDEGAWRARTARSEALQAPVPNEEVPAEAGALARLLGRAGRRLGLGPRPAAPAARFPELAYIPYRAGEDYILPPPAAPERTADGGLPIPPASLWTADVYALHGAEQVARMLALVEDSGFAFRDGDRVLDLGCGPGRMIRHLEPLAGRCEIWGADIDAEAILWCRAHLSPPFHFVTTTKVPHLPFADGSLRFVYCASLFTHIDDLAAAWLLELRRVLAPDGRLYLTLHDNRTVALFEEGAYRGSAVAEGIRASPTYQRAKAGFGMFTIGRDADSQVFYDRRWFAAMAAPAFEILSVTEQAYHYQTAYLLRPAAQ
ncbi:MAG: methyltransferase domain-containing protein [Alphaproteobacteria bacterium]|nr:methyltransferase domain-containing protein [Alphaproteobacteria bacterium]MBV9370301.1 methyltransferase domain-containing protein [Alphaproteobacteria bacterium]MBV9901169.1 methyltransferase domain-containing protein [Alphaproteobacteria bacterium]